MSGAGVLAGRMRLSAYREGHRGARFVDMQLDGARRSSGLKRVGDEVGDAQCQSCKPKLEGRGGICRWRMSKHGSLHHLIKGCGPILRPHTPERRSDKTAPSTAASGSYSVPQKIANRHGGATIARAALVAWAVLAAVAPPAVAKDLGVRGETWPIAEPDLLEQIGTRLAALELSGETARFEREAIARARAHVEAPPRVTGVVPATEPRSWLFDPSIVIERDVATPDGTVIAAAGTRVNPLLARPLSRDVLFVDGARTVEVAWALAQPRPARIVLVGGRPLALSRAHGRSFFFDQGGALTARLGIAATPARAFQEGAALRIEETPLEDRAPFEAVGRASASAPVETGR